MHEEWTGLWVCVKHCFEKRHPQDFVQGQDEDISVDVASPGIVQEVGETTTADDTARWSVSVILASITGLSDKDPVGIVMDNGATHWSFIDGDPSGATGGPLIDADGEVVYDANGTIVYTADYYLAEITLGSPIPYEATLGNTVYLPSLNNESWQ
jgi:hypothetical protein